MTMQIKNILLYNSHGDIRPIRFKLGQVNVIVGNSSTGKSTLIDIVDYCLGHSNFKIPEGVIRDNVAWYAVVFQFGETQVLVAKPAPEPFANSQNAVYLETGVDLAIPPLSKLFPNSNDAALKQYLSKLVGISPNINVPNEGETRQPLEANIHHASLFLFQEQNVIANRNVLFHKQTEPWVAQAIKDTLPYFLGAVREDKLKLLDDLRNARRELRQAQNDLTEAETIAANSSLRGSSLLAEAQQVGLVEPLARVENNDDLLRLLATTAQWQPTAAIPISDDRVLRLQHELDTALSEFRRLSDQILEANLFAKETEGYSSEASEQQLRLESVNIIGTRGHDPLVCPVCSSQLTQPIASVDAMRKSLADLQMSLTNVVRERPRLREHIQHLETKREEQRQRVAQLHEAIAAVQNEQVAAQEIREANSRIARVVGRISLFLETLQRIDEQSDLKLRVENARKRVEQINEQLDPSESLDIQTSILSSISADMTDWAKKLQLEFTGLPYRLDINHLTVVVDRSGRPIRMNQGLGGGANWLGCHLIAHLALHKLFAERQRPIPRFLMLDQPTQIWFPPDKFDLLDGSTDELPDEDRVAVNRMFDFLFEICASLAPNFQIIVTDHANLSTEKFRNALVEEPWRGGRALVPQDWLSKSQDTDKITKPST